MRPSLRPTWPTNSSLLAWLPRATPHRVPRRIATTSAHNAAPVDLPKMVLSPGSPHHNSLPTFLDYAKRTNLALDSTLFIGTHYEYTSALALMRLGFSLLRIGRTSDAGIDLIGHWVLAPLREPLPVIIQCKARKISVNPSHIRELEGSFCGIPPDWTKKDVLGLLVTTKKATRGVLEAVGHSHWPMGFVLISQQGLIQQFVWNRAACDRGLEGVGVTVRHTPRILLPDAEHETEQDESGTAKKRLAKFKNAGTRRDIQLTWMGSPIFPERKDLDQETLGLMRQIPADDKVVKVAKVAKVATVVAMEKRRPGRPKGSKNKPLVEATETVGPRPRGRPKGSKNQSTLQAEKEATYKPRGRPKGTTKHYAEKMPFPRGGLVPRTLKSYCGRPKGAKTKR
ncbi:hypothetical protein GGP41_001958 [Bipolaris sorokiniana]|uniref:Required for respiratory growth protein 7, mitochondrial n=2 Tax=Cochliobolus sativus TaxID=45130 RepID=A0A8H5ZQA3_COCSA|nr:uncharacterized protein COCSADRAFT_38445 [Bipolaris sorokiniana ND90Pr]EMD62530.1 hypothetical protein COCSADRAFT_38445 [Bipolaris sorokiniana ND90Pr]KAF5853392.1 hypothetical protein GGP41_001958 [Bipolaris sorokiniana]